MQGVIDFPEVKNNELPRSRAARYQKPPIGAVAPRALRERARFFSFPPCMLQEEDKQKKMYIVVVEML